MYRCRRLTKDLVYGGVGGQGAVEDAELPLEPLGDVVAPTAGVAHGGQELDVHDVGELPGLLQVVEAPLLHQLPHYLIGDLRKGSALQCDSKYNCSGATEWPNPLMLSHIGNYSTT